jgi:hypothetical protein
MPPIHPVYTFARCDRSALIKNPPPLPPSPSWIGRRQHLLEVKYFFLRKRFSLVHLSYHKIPAVQDIDIQQS